MPRVRAARVFRPRINNEEDLTPEKFRERFRLAPDVVGKLVDRIQEDIQHNTDRNNALSPKDQVLLTLRFLATGTFYHVVGDAHGPSRATVHRTVHRVMAAIVKRLLGVIRFPRTVGECRAAQQSFFQVAGLPDVIGCIDGCHVGVRVPAADENAYINRHQQTSLNVMAVAGSDGRFYCVSAHAGGRQHDSRVLSTSGLPERMERNALVPVEEAVLLGDSAYPSRTWLLTPIGHPRSRAEERYNRAHCRTRVAVERGFGQLKMRFACLHGSGLRLRNVADSVLAVMTCCILHNVAKMEGDGGDWLGEAAAVANVPAEQPPQQLPAPREAEAVVRRRAFERRARFVNRFEE